MDIEPEAESADAGGAWSRVDVNNEKPADLAAGESRLCYFIVYVYFNSLAHFKYLCKFT